MDSANDYEFNEDEISSPLRFSISDQETDFTNLIVTVGSQNADLIADNQIQINNDGSGNYELLVTPNQDQHGSVNWCLMLVMVNFQPVRLSH